MFFHQVTDVGWRNLVAEFLQLTSDPDVAPGILAGHPQRLRFSGLGFGRPAGPRPCRLRILPTVWSETRYPRLASAPTMRSKPQAGFSVRRGKAHDLSGREIPPGNYRFSR